MIDAGIKRTGIRRREIRNNSEPKFPLPDMFQCIERSRDVPEKSTLFLSRLYHETSSHEDPHMPNVR